METDMLERIVEALEGIHKEMREANRHLEDLAESSMVLRRCEGTVGDQVVRGESYLRSR